MLKVALLLFSLARASALYTNDPNHQEFLWSLFKSEYRKTYFDKVEDNYRFNVFLSNLQLADERNAKETGTAVHGITTFMDMTHEEFSHSHLNYVPRQVENRTYAPVVALAPWTNVAKDWTDVFTTPVKDQGYCGSCWAFSATEQIETDYMRSGGPETVLSTQQVTSCTKYRLPSAGGCNGGWTESAFEYAQNGLELEEDYPYISGKAGITGTCSASPSLFKVKTTSYTTVSDDVEGEAKMATYVASYGPLSVCVDANNWSTYTGGVLETCGTSVDHCVQVVGIDTYEGYWKVRNSWGTSWGEDGFIRLKYGVNQCEIASDANFVETEEV